MKRTKLATFFAGVACAAAVACTGLVADGESVSAPGSAPGAAGSGAPATPGAPGVPAGAAGAQAPASCGAGPRGFGASPLRRLKREEYRNAIADLFGVTPPAASALPEDGSIGGFSTTAGQPLNAGQTLKYFDAVTGLAPALTAKMGAMLGCASQKLDEAACVQRFLDTTGTRVFRRPLTKDEAAHYRAIFTDARALVSMEESATAMVQAMLVSPQFMFLMEPAAPAPGQPAPLDSWQMATRLSTLLWRTIPDAALLEAAGRDELRSKTAVAAQVRRMLGDPRARQALGTFFDEWLSLSDIERVQKDTKRFPDATSAAIAALAQETRRFVDDAVWSGNGDLGNLLVSAVRFRSKALSKFYGDAAGTTDDVTSTMGAIDEKTFGLLSQAGFLMAIGHGDDPAPIYRGKFLRTQLLCGTLPPPPPGLASPLPMFKPGMTNRQRVETHTAGAACTPCHSLMNPLGFALEHFDGAGRWRDVDNGSPVDTRTEVTASDITGAVDGGLDLSRRLAASRSVKDCVAAQAFEFALSRVPAPEDSCALSALQQKAGLTQLGFKDLFAEITQSDAFFARVEPKE